MMRLPRNGTYQTHVCAIAEKQQDGVLYSLRYDFVEYTPAHANVT